MRVSLEDALAAAGVQTLGACGSRQRCAAVGRCGRIQQRMLTHQRQTLFLHDLLEAVAVLSPSVLQLRLVALSLGTLGDQSIRFIVLCDLSTQ